MGLIDTHAHIDYFIKRGELDDMLSRARTAGIERIITCSTIPADWSLYQETSKKYPDIISWQVGIHPTEISQNDDLALDALASYFADGDSKPVAIGEIGLDFYRLPADPDEIEKTKLRMLEIFRRQLMIAADLNVKVCVHARNALNECCDEISKSGMNFSNIVFHCYSGTAAEVAEINELGARASFTGIITYKNADEMRKAMLTQGLDMLMLETDCPYLPPVSLRGKTCEPAMLSHTTKAAAEIFGVSPQDLENITTRNAREFFGC